MIIQHGPFCNGAGGFEGYVLKAVYTHKNILFPRPGHPYLLHKEGEELPPFSIAYRRAGR